MPNQYVNKVVQSNGTTLIDISDTTAVASDVASGKYFYLASGEKVEGTASGGGSSGQAVTGTITGTGTTILEIPCTFAPDIIYIYTDLSDDVTKRGVVDFYLNKDRMYYIGRDSSKSDSSVIHEKVLITGYGDDLSQPYASYSNNILTINTVSNTSSMRWVSGQTYTYELTSFDSGSSA